MTTNNNVFQQKLKLPTQKRKQLPNLSDFCSFYGLKNRIETKRTINLLMIEISSKSE